MAKTAISSRKNDPIMSFNAGEIGDEVMGRTGLENYGATGSLYENAWPIPEGPLILRPGLKFYSDLGRLTYLRRWLFALNQKYLMAFSDSELRITQDGGVIFRPAVTSTVTAGTFATLVGWTDISAGGGAAAISSGRLQLTSDGSSIAGVRQQVATSSAGTLHALRIVVERGPIKFKVGSVAGGADYIDTQELRTGTHSLAFTPSGSYWIEIWSALQRETYVDSCTVEATGDLVLPTPFTDIASDFAELRFVQSKDVLYVGYGTGPKKRIERRSVNSWSITNTDEKDGPFRTPNTDESVTVEPSVTSGNGTLDASAALFQAGHVGALWQATHSGQRVERAITGENQFTDPIKITGIDAARLFTRAFSGSFSDITMTVQKSAGSTTNWQDVASVTFASAASANITDPDDNETIYYRFGVKTGNYPADIAVTGTGAGTAGRVRLTVTSTASFTTGEFKQVSGVLGTTEANGTWSVNVIDATHIDLVGTTFANAWISGGAVGPGTPTVSLTYTGGSTPGVARITGYVSPTQVEIEVLDNFAAATPTFEWAEGSWSDVQGWPKGVGLFDGRLWNGYADEFWGSSSDRYESYEAGTEADNAINRLVATGSADSIQAILPLNRLLLLTEGAEANAKSSDFDEAITPSNITTRDISSWGAGNVAPLKVDSRGIYVDRSSVHIMELVYDVDTQGYIAKPMTRLHKNIGRPGIIKLAIARRPETRLFALRSDGICLVKLYDPGENVLGWARLKVDRGDKVIDVEVLPGASGEGEDEVWFTIRRRTPTGYKFYLEKLGNFHYETLADANCLDSYVRIDGAASYAVEFDGAGYMTRGADLTGGADGKTGTVSVWVKFGGEDADDTREQVLYSSTGDFFTVKRTAAGKWQVTAKNSAGTVILSLVSEDVYGIDNGWHHLMASWDLATATGQLYIDGVPNLAAGSVLTNDTIDYTRADHAIGATTAGATKIEAEISELYINIASAVDLSVLANRSKFRALNGKPVNLGSTGNTPTGTAPRIYLSSAAATLQTNRGTGGNFTVSGYLWDSETGPPSDYLASTVTTVSGLDHLEGRSVIAWADGQNMGTFTVTSGAIDIRVQYAQVSVGLYYEGLYTTSKLSLSAQMGTPIGQLAQIGKIIFLFSRSSSNVEYGVSFDQTMDNIAANPLAKVTYDVDGLQSGVSEQVAVPGTESDRDARLCLRMFSPFPVTLQGIVLGQKTMEQ
jgi:hypothetical protein